MKIFTTIILAISLSGCGSIMFCRNLPTVHNEDSTNFGIVKPFKCE